MNNKQKAAIAAAASIVLASLVACGGGGSSAPAVTVSAEGVYEGTLTGSTSTGFQLLFLEDGTYWSLYGTPSASVFLVRGFVQGSGTSSNGQFTSSTAKDFGVAPAASGSLNATYTNTYDINGTIANPSGTVGFAGKPPASTFYVYTNAASPAAIAGAWSLTTLSGETLNVSIAAGGAITGTSSLGCSFTGSAVPRASGKNVFNLSLTFGAAPCALPGQTATGIALTYPLATGKNQLIVAGVDSTRTVGTAAFGTR